MSLRRRGPNEDWEFLPAADRARVLAWESLPLGRIAALAATLVIAYLALSGSFASGQVSLDTGGACSLENGEERMWLWAHTGPSFSEGWTSGAAGLFCEEATPTPSPTPPSTPLAELVVAKTGSPDLVAIDGTLAYSVTVNNSGAITASNVVITDTLPDQVGLISSTPSQGSCDGISCFLGGLAPGETAVISYVALVTEGDGSSLVNVACVMTSSTESDLTNNCDDEETQLKTSFAATSTPNGMPAGGRGPLDGGPTGLPLLLLLGIGLTVMGGVAGLVSTLRMTNRE